MMKSYAPSLRLAIAVFTSAAPVRTITAASGSVLAHVLEQLDAPHDRHLEVGDGQGRPRGPEHLEAFVPVVGEQTLVVGAEEDLVQDLADLAIVVDDQDVAPLHVSPPSRPARAPTTWFLPARFAA